MNRSSGTKRLLGVKGRSYVLNSDSRSPDNSPRSSTGWLAVHTRYQHEGLAARSLAYKGFEVFLPVYISARQWSDRTRKRSAPLFPGYVFLRGELNRQIGILTSPGVLDLVRFEGVPAIIPDTEIEAVRQILARRLQVEPYPFLECGEWVRIKDGPLESLEGILVRHKRQFRLVLSVQLLQKSVAVEVDAWLVERAPRHERPGSATSFNLNPCSLAQAW